MYGVFLAVVFIHFCEHLAQMYQLYILHWARPECLGFVGLKYPWLMHSEWLHYFFALYMLVGLNYFYYKARSKFWWNISIGAQTYHHFEHVLLLSQAIGGIPMKDRLSIGSFLMPRLELHFVYNLLVLIFMLLGAFYLDKQRKDINVLPKNL